MIKLSSCHQVNHEHGQSPDGQKQTVKQEPKETGTGKKESLKSSGRGTPSVKKESQESEEDDVYIQVFFRKSELDHYCDYEGTVKEGEMSGALFTIHKDSILSEGGDANLAKKR